MISLPRIFATGYQMTAVGIYFNQVQLAERLKYYQKEELNDTLKRWVEHLKGISESFAISVLETNQFLKSTGYENPELPQIPSQYVDWVNNAHNWVLGLLPEDKLPRALYLYGFCIGEIMTILTMLSCALDFQTAYDISFDQMLKKGQNDLKVVQRRWGSIAKALGVIDDLNIFLEEYLKADHSINTLFVKDVNALGKKEQVEITTKIRNHIDFLENLTIKLQEHLPQNPFPLSPEEGTQKISSPDADSPRDRQ